MRKAKKKTRLSKECLEKNLDDVIAVAQKEGVVVDPLTISSRKTVYECPYNGCSKEFEFRGLLYHLLKAHKAQDNCTASCPFCDKRMNSLMLIGHLENNHPELDVKGELKELKSSIEPIHNAIRESVLSRGKHSTKRHSVAEKIKAALGLSIFEPVPNVIPFAEFRDSLRRKLIEDTKRNRNLLFKFLVRANTLEWGCLICTEHAGLTFKNPFSLRLNALFHLEKHVDEEHFDHLQTIITKEWSQLKQEIPRLPIHKMRGCGYLPTNRSFLSYSLLRDDDCVGETMDVIDRCYLDDPSKNTRNALCLLCHSPFSVSLSQPLATPKHFLVDSHRHLNAKGWSEFSEVEEIAKIPHREERDAHSALLFSSFSHITDEEDATPKKIYKWRCTLCSLDVSVFPSPISLRLFALRHLEKEHPHTFNEHFYTHEWSLLQIETSLVNMRRFSQDAHIRQKGRHVDITDPSDFIFPWSRSLRVPSPEYYTCGHCFFVSTEAEIRDHLAGHGFVAGNSSMRIVVEDGGQEGMIDEKTIRRIRKNLCAPSSILFGESPSGGEGMRMCEEEECDRPSTPANTQKRLTAITETPKSKYRLRARSVTRYIPLEESTNAEDTMSSEESDSGLEKNYQTMSGDDTMEDTVDEDEDMTDEVEVVKERRGSSVVRVTSSKKNANTCTESSVAFDDMFDTGVEMAIERGEQSRTRERERERERVHEKAFRWEGDEPPQLTAEQVELIREFKEGGRCSLCPRTKGYRGVGRMTNVERSLMAHLIVNHASNDDAMAVVTRKRYLLSKSLESGGTEPIPPFLLQSVHPHHLTCSRCMDFKCAKQANLVVHWESCTGVRGNRGRSVNRRVKKEEMEEEEKEEKDEGMEEESRVTPKRTMRSVRCPLCREGWKKSTHYSDDVSVAIHLMMKHTTDQEAYTMAMQLEEETNLQSSFPFIHLTDSFSLRVEQPDSGIQCALCHVNSPTLASAIRHATRSHASAKEKEDANFTPGLLSCPLPSSSCSIRSILVGRQRSITALHFLHVLFKHDRKEKEARLYMKEINNETVDQLRTESNLRLDVQKTVESWRSGKTRLVCSLCSLSSCRLQLYAKHFEDNDCGLTTDRLRQSRPSRSKEPSRTPSRALSRTPTDVMSTERRGRGRAPEAAMNCAHCDRVIYASATYAPSISMDIHLIKMHPTEKTMTSASVFPFIDFSLSTADNLQCALCEYTAKESRYIVPHAWTKHTEESKRSQGMLEWAQFEMSMERKREKQRISCARPMKRLREKMRMEKEEEGEEGRETKRRRITEGEDDVPSLATATPILRRTPRQRSAVSRWLDTSLAGTSTYSPSIEAEGDLRDRLDKLFSCADTPSASQQTHADSSIFKELPQTAMSRIASQGRAEDISHIKGVEGVRCSVCSFKGRDTESLRIHFNETHQEVSSLSVPDVFPCAACERVFNSKKKWRCHCEEDHAPKDRPFQCFKCEYRYETHQKLRAHQIRVHESEIMVHPNDRSCFKCNKLFGSLRAYQNHKKRHEERERMNNEEE